jgi:hypothetical protein
MEMTKQRYNPLNCNPRDRVAARVVFGSGVHYDPEVKSQSQRFQDVPHKMRDLATLPGKVKCDPSFKDYTGYVVGSFTVVGMLLCHKFDTWVLRCSCGAYEIRTTTAINKAVRTDQRMCQSCLDLERIKHQDFFQKNGIYPWQESESRRKRNRRKPRCKAALH